MANDIGKSAATAPSVLFEARNITKSFGSVVANRDVSLTVKAGEKHALLGENGAGKSTFVKMIDGVLHPDRGGFFWNGRRVKIGSPAVARRLGIGMVFQHFASFEALTVAENIAIAMPNLSLRAIRRNIRDISERYGLKVEPGRRIERLSAGEKQRVEIVRALMQKPKLLILDEPTSVLTPQEADGLFDTLNALSDDGMAVIYISHRLTEIKDFCDRATVLRHGEVVGTCDPATASVSEMAEMMIGKTADPIQRHGSYVGGARLVVDDLSMPVREGIPLRNVSFTARRGEVMAIAGVAGEGQDTLFAALSGERRTPYIQKIIMDGSAVGAMGPTARRRLGVAFAPEDRLGHAALPDLPLSDNLRLTSHWQRGSGRNGLRKRSTKIRKAYDVRAGAGDPKAGTLSGGNLQKFVIGRELERDPGLFIVAQPTWGVDAGAAAAIRNELLTLTRGGGAVVVISQDLDEIFQIADRVAVLHRGKLSKTHLIDDMTPEKIGMLMAGADISEEKARDYVIEQAPRPIAPAAPKLIPPPDTPPPTQQAPAQPAIAPRPPVRQVPTQQPKRLPIAAQASTRPGLTLRLGVSGTVTTPWTPPEQFQTFEPRS